MESLAPVGLLFQQVKAACRVQVLSSRTAALLQSSRGIFVRRVEAGHVEEGPRVRAVVRVVVQEQPPALVAGPGLFGILRRKQRRAGFMSSTPALA